MSYYHPYSPNSRLKLTVTSPPQSFVEPVSVADAKLMCDIPDADQTRDALLEAMITSARMVAELRQGRDLVTKQWDLTMDRIPEVIETRDNLTSVDLFQYTDSTGTPTVLVEVTDFIKDTVQNLIMPPYGESWPSFTPYPSSAVLVRYTVTPPAVDSQVLQGMKFLVSMWYANRIPVTEEARNMVVHFPFCLGLLDHGKVEAL